MHHRNQWPVFPGFFKPIDAPVIERRVWLNGQKGAPLATACSVAASAAPGWLVLPLLVGGLLAATLLGLRKGFHQTATQVRTLGRARVAAEVPPGPMSPTHALGLRGVAQLRRQDRWRARFALASVGGLSPVGGAASTVGILAKPALIGGVAAGFATAAYPLGWVAVSAVTLSALIAGGYDLVGAWKLRGVQQRIEAVHLDSWLGIEDTVLTMACARLRDIRRHGVANGVSNLALAVSVPLAFGLGPIGLSVMLPAIAASFVTAYMRSSRIEYGVQISAADKLPLADPHRLSTEVWRAQAHYEALKALKRERRLHFPYGLDTPVGGAAWLWAWGRRQVQAHAPRAALAQETVQRYWHHYIQVETLHWQRNLQVGQRQAHTTATLPMREALLLQQQAERELLQLETLTQRLAAWPDLSAQDAMTLQHDLLHHAGLLRIFAAQLLGDRALRRQLLDVAVEHDGQRWRFDPAAAEAWIAGADVSSQQHVLERYGCLTETVLLTQAKRQQRDRVRELLDFFIACQSLPPAP